MIDGHQARDILRSHDQWVERHRRRWAERLALYTDRFWGDTEQAARALDGTIRSGARGLVPIQVNQLRPWVTSFLSSLYYRGVQFTVEPDEVIASGEPTDKQQRSREALAVRKVVNRFFTSEEVEGPATRLFIQGLLYEGGGGTRVGRRDPDPLVEEEPLDTVWWNDVPPWELVVDRRVRHKARQRFVGWTGYVPHDEVGADRDDAEALPDVVRDGHRPMRRQEEGDRAYVRVFELHDLTGAFKGKRGRTTVYLVKGYGPMLELEEVGSGPVPYEGPGGKPLTGLDQVVLEPHPDFATNALAPAETQYELNAELNRAASVLATAFRKDANRITLYLKNAGIDEKVIDRIVNGEDQEWVPVDAVKGQSRPLRDLMFTVNEKFSPFTPTGVAYMDKLGLWRDETQVTADLTRGEAVKYSTATEVANLVEYTETTIGRLRKEMDKAFARSADTAARVIAAAMRAGKQASLTVLVEDEPTEVTPEMLERRWKYQVMDTASTPAAKARKLTDFVALLDPILALAEVLQMKEAMAAAALDHLVELADLPKTMDPNVLVAQQPEPEPAPEVAPPPGAPGVVEELPPDAAAQAEVLANSPAAQGIMDAAEAEVAI